MEDIIKDTQKMVSQFYETQLGRIKVPIVGVYLVILCTYNWDFLSILIFYKSDVLMKVNYLKSADFGINYWRVIMPLVYSIIFTPMFQLLQIVINQLMKMPRRIERVRLHFDAIDDANSEKTLTDIRSGNLEKQQLQNNIDGQLHTIQSQTNEIEEKNKLISQKMDEISSLKDSLEKSNLILQKIREEEQKNAGTVTDGIKKIKIYYFSLDTLERQHLKGIVSSIPSDADIVDFTEELMYGRFILNNPIFDELVRMNFLRQAIDNDKRKVFEVTELGRAVFINLNQTKFFEGN